MKVIRITKCAQRPEEISEPCSLQPEWLKLEVPVLSDQEAHDAEKLTGNIRPSKDYFYIRGIEAIKAFLKANRVAAARFWSPNEPPPYICIPKSNAEIIQY